MEREREGRERKEERNTDFDILGVVTTSKKKTSMRRLDSKKQVL
jgi:hypothetical protein